MKRSKIVKTILKNPYIDALFVERTRLHFLKPMTIMLACRLLFFSHYSCHSAVNLVKHNSWKEFIANNNKFYKTLDNIDTTEGAGVVKVSKHSPWRRNPQHLPEKEKGVSYQSGRGARGSTLTTDCQTVWQKCGITCRARIPKRLQNKLQKSSLSRKRFSFLPVGRSNWWVAEIPVQVWRVGRKARVMRRARSTTVNAVQRHNSTTEVQRLALLGSP